MKKRFFVIQSKGGVGKSYLVKLLTLRATMNGSLTHFIDLDNASATLTKFSEGINSKKGDYVKTGNFVLLGSNKKIDRSRFDSFLGEIEKLDQVVCDFGAASSEQLLYYLQEEKEVVNLFKSMGVHILFVVAGGGSIQECVKFFNEANEIPGLGEITSIVANEVQGGVNGMSVQEYTDAPVQLRTLNGDSTSEAQVEWEQMVSKGVVLDDIEKLSIIRRSRIKQYLSQIFIQIDKL